MQFPDAPTCHHVPSPSPFPAPHWEAATGGGPRTCSYCGSWHPEDLVRLLSQRKIELGGSDWKYGWPHKFYVYEAPDPVAVENMRALDPGRRALGRQVGKWYNDQILDRGFDDEARTALTDALEASARVRFEIVGDRLGYRAPHFGFQA